MKTIIHSSKNNHYVSAENITLHKIHDTNSVQLMELKGVAKITHAEHDTIELNSRWVLKYTQQELDPITNKFVDIYD